jgi:pimeloyl-ACP methyl ester carboxylesterase
MTRTPHKTVPVDDVSLAYSDVGSGYPVVFINGLASTMDMWNPPILTRISEHFRVIIFDNRGTGYSGSSDKPFSIPLLARDTAGLMDALGISAAHILGLSMGASVAQELALSYPEKVDKLILVAGECGGSESVRMQPAILATLMDKSGTIPDVVNRMFSLLFPASWWATHDPFHYCPEVYETTSDEVVARQAAAFFAWTGSFDRLGKIRSPTLVITGTEDVIVPPVNSTLISGRIPGAQLVEIAGAGHGLMYQFPDMFCDNVLTFLDR